ncbi:uncharacterized protein LOC143021655 [Oratosquilla oratoria]|uniref:uncharacterized protein LOC143021655 n=1 Tax=Oratosquilla oratoria TaxID=337810 RepID=UPI003F763A3A
MVTFGKGTISLGELPGLNRLDFSGTGTAHGFSDMSATSSSGTISTTEHDTPIQVSILRDTATKQSFILAQDLTNPQLTYLHSDVLLDGIGGTRKCPLHKIYLTSDLVTGPVEVAVIDSLTVPGIQLLLANDLAEPETLTSKDPLPLTRENLLQEQKSDETLVPLFEKVVTEAEVNNIDRGHYIRKGVLVRKFCPAVTPANQTWEEIHQIVVPTSYREKVLDLAHSSTLSGHLGVKKTLKRVSAHFHWLTLVKDITEYCRGCPTCQLVGKSNKPIPVAPLHPIPAIGEPFSKILIDVVGPLPPSKKGFKYILTIMCLATRFPEAISLKDTRAKHSRTSQDDKREVNGRSPSSVASISPTNSRKTGYCLEDCQRDSGKFSKEDEEKRKTKRLVHINALKPFYHRVPVVSHSTVGVEETRRFFPQPELPLQNFKILEALDSKEPIKLPPYRLNPTKRECLRKEVNSLINQGIIELSHSPWSSPYILIPRSYNTFRADQARLTLNLAKSEFGQAQLAYLGHAVGNSMIRPLDLKVKAITNLPRPTNRREVRRMLGNFGYYRRYCNNFAEIAEPLTNLLRKDQRFKWTPTCDRAFEHLKYLLNHSPVLITQDYTLPFHLYTDASEVGIDAALQQERHGTERAVAYFSGKLNPAQPRYSTIEKECLALIKASRHFEPIIGGHFEIHLHTDHNPLVYLHRMANSNQRLTRWSSELQTYPITFHHVKGSENVVADTLSCCISLEEGGVMTIEPS